MISLLSGGNDAASCAVIMSGAAGAAARGGGAAEAGIQSDRRGPLRPVRALSGGVRSLLVFSELRRVPIDQRVARTPGLGFAPTRKAAGGVHACSRGPAQRPLRRPALVDQDPNPERFGRRETPLRGRRGRASGRETTPTTSRRPGLERRPRSTRRMRLADGCRRHRAGG